MPITRGVDHVGLTVRDLPTTIQFFTDVLGYQKLGEDPSYPAAFLSDGSTMLTFWQAQDPERATPFDRHHQVGLHHLAIAIDPTEMDALHHRLQGISECTVEFAPEPSYGGPRRHMMIALPGSGIRLEIKDATPTG